MLCLFSLSTTIRYTTLFFFFFFNDTATTEIYTLSLHDALPILLAQRTSVNSNQGPRTGWSGDGAPGDGSLRSFATDRKSTRLNSSHLVISYAVFCLKKKTKHHAIQRLTSDTAVSSLHSARLASC